MPLKPRPYTIETYTMTVCPECMAERRVASHDPGVWKDGMLVTHSGSVWLRRFCARHGESESLYEEVEELWRAREGWNAPTLTVTPDRAANDRPFPLGYRDGLPAAHGQHTCILLLNITDRCNYACSTCYAGASAASLAATDERPTVEEVLHTVRTVLAREAGKLGVLMLSGGEPTQRDDLPEIIERLLEFNITRILINTNGRRIAQDDRLLACLARHRKRIEVHLQYNGLRAATHRAFHHQNVAGEKAAALQRLTSAGIWTTLVMAVQRGVNEDEVGALVQLGLATPRCAGLTVQPVFGSGRTSGIDPRTRVTPTAILSSLEGQTGGLLSSSDFIPLPCSARDCCDITYLLKTADGTWRSLPALIGREELKRWMHLVANTISFETASEGVSAMLRSGALQRVFSEQLPPGAPDLTRDIGALCDCIPGLSRWLGGIWQLVHHRENALEQAAERTFRITVKMFMDAHTLHAARLRQCCVHIGSFEADPRRFPFCWRWLFADGTDFAEDAPGTTLRS